jgi:hypothetical protein
MSRRRQTGCSRWRPTRGAYLRQPTGGGIGGGQVHPGANALTIGSLRSASRAKVVWQAATSAARGAASRPVTAALFVHAGGMGASRNGLAAA